MIRLVLMLLLILVGNSALFAQTGILKGKVKNAENGEAIMGTEVFVTINRDTIGRITDAAGHYKITGLIPDTCNLIVKDIRQEKKVFEDIVIQPGKVTVKNVTLKLPKGEVRISGKNQAFQSADMAVIGGKGKEEKSSGKKPPKGRYKPDFNREEYGMVRSNPVKAVKDHPLSTFSVEVDNASYANARRFINDHELPPKDAIRVEEFINYFEYDYPEPNGTHPFSIHTELGKCPWKEDRQLLHVGLEGKTIKKEDLPPSNLVFLVDVSGSMNSRNKLPLLKKSLKLLVDKLRGKDKITIVVYAGSSGIALPTTTGDEKVEISKAIHGLKAGGRTAGSKGIKLAYEKAEENFMPEGNNRVILATDGDFNVGVTSKGALTRLIEKKRESGVFLSILGFGKDNYQGAKMEQLSNKGNGNYSYIDNILEAKKSLISEMSGTLYTIAKDVKVQVEFNPAKVQSYRLLGYVNRQLDREDFDNDAVDAGEIGAGHSVTALYEIIPADEVGQNSEIGDSILKYQEKSLKERALATNEVGMVKFRYKEPDESQSKMIKQPIDRTITADPSKDFYWSTAVAMFGMELRNSEYKGETDYSLIDQMAQKGLGEDPYGYRNALLNLIEKAKMLGQAND